MRWQVTCDWWLIAGGWRWSTEYIPPSWSLSQTLPWVSLQAPGTEHYNHQHCTGCYIRFLASTRRIHPLRTGSSSNPRTEGMGYAVHCFKANSLCSACCLMSGPEWLAQCEMSPLLFPDMMKWLVLRNLLLWLLTLWCDGECEDLESLSGRSDGGNVTRSCNIWHSDINMRYTYLFDKSMAQKRKLFFCFFFT